jgi:two-component system, NtrC family, sensor kinase
MLVVLLLFGLTPLLAMGAAGFLANREEGEGRARKVLDAMVQNRKATIELFLDSQLDALAFAAASQPLRALATPAGLETVRQLLHGRTGAIVELTLLDGAGRPLAYTGPYTPAMVDGKAPWLEEVRVLGRYESDVFLGLGRFPHMKLAVSRRDGGDIYVLEAIIDASILGGLVREGVVESSADVFLLDRAGEYQTQVDERRKVLDRAGLPVTLHPGVQVRSTRSGGRREMIATTWLRRDRWVLVARQRLPSFAGDLVAHPTVTVVFILGVLCVPPLSLLVARRRLQQIRGLEGERAALLESVAQSQKMATIGRLAATVAHEINNPLAVIDAQIGVVSDTLAGESTPQAREICERVKKIQAQVERGRKVTHRLLGFSRRVGPDLEMVEVQAALEEAVGFLEKETEAAGTRFVRNYQLDVPMIRTSLAQIQQVFLNLLNNAVDALGGQGEIVLTIRRAGEGVDVTISDNGPGIPESKVRDIFEPFFSTKGGNHAGLGLAICREIMQNLGGDIEVESRPGQGTTFTLRFPAAAPEDEARSAASAKETA